jgi:hypothetical protein
LRGGAQGYQVWFCHDQVEQEAEGQEVSVCRKSTWRRLQPYRMTGNRDHTVIVGHHMTLLATFLIPYPNAATDKIAAFLYDRTGRMYGDSSIYKHLIKLCVTNKKASINAYQRPSERIQFCVWAFWNCLTGLGIVGILSQRFIDVDKFGISLAKANHKFAWAPTCYRVRKDGHHQHGVNITVLFAIKPIDPAVPPQTHVSIQCPCCWI